MRARTLMLNSLIALATTGGLLASSNTIAQAGVKHEYTGQQITEAPPGNSLLRPWGLTFDAQGNLYVTDTGEGENHSVVDVFNSANQFTTQLGSGFLDSTGGARSVAVVDDATTGYVYVADSEESTVLVFKPNKGEYEHVATWTGALTKLEENRFHGQLHVAVDNSSGPRKGDVYVMIFQDVFAEIGIVEVFKPGPSGEEGEVVEENPGPAGGFQFARSGRNEGLAVQESPGPTEGDLYVTDTHAGTKVNETLNTVDVFNDSGVEQRSLAPNGGSLSEAFLPVEAAGASVALDNSTGEVYVADTTHDVVDEYSSSGVFLGQITGTCPSPGVCGAGEVIPFGGVLGVAVQGSGPNKGDVYVADGANNAVDIFGPDIPPPLPEVAAQSSLDVTQTTAIMQATINPDESSTSYHFEWGTTPAYGASVPVPDGPVGAGITDVNVEQQIVGLRPGTTYHFRVVATNSGGTTEGEDQTFTTPPPEPPAVETGVAGTITQNGANLSGMVHPRGFHTTYEFDLGTDTSYGTRLFGSAGSASSVQTVTVGVQGLAASTTYHYRLLASNIFGTSYGADQTFTTPSFPTSVLAAPVAPALLPVPPIAFPARPGDPVGKPPVHKRKKPKQKAKKRSTNATRTSHHHNKRKAAR